MDNLDPLPLKSKIGNGAVYRSCGFILDLGGGGGEGVLFHFILFTIVAPFNLIINITNKHDEELNKSVLFLR